MIINTVKWNMRVIAKIVVINGFFFSFGLSHLAADIAYSDAQDRISDLTAEIINPDYQELEWVKAGPLSVNAGLKTGVSIENNIYQIGSPEQYDEIILVDPSFGLKIPMFKNYLTTAYEASINNYLNTPENDYANQRFQGLEIFPLGNLQLSVEDIFQKFTQITSPENNVLLEQYVNDSKISLQSEAGRLAWTLSYVTDWQYYINDAVVILGPMTYHDKDCLTHVVDLESEYKLSPKTSLLFEGDYGYLNYYNGLYTPDSYYVEALTGMQGDWLSKLSVNFRLGLRYHEYGPSTLLNTDSYDNFIGKGYIKYSFTESDDLLLYINQNTYESDYQNMNYFQSFVTNLEYTHRMEKIELKLSGSYEDDTYPKDSIENGVTDRRYDHTYQTAATLSYAMSKWLAFAASDNYSKRDSRFDIYDYKNNIASIYSTVAY